MVILTSSGDLVSLLTSTDVVISCQFVKRYMYINYIFINLTFNGDRHDSCFDKHGEGGCGDDGDGSLGGDAVT